MISVCILYIKAHFSTAALEEKITLQHEPEKMSSDFFTGHHSDAKLRSIHVEVNILLKKEAVTFKLSKLYKRKQMLFMSTSFMFFPQVLQRNFNYLSAYITQQCFPWSLTTE